MSTIIITGASQGLGEALAFVLHENGHDLILHHNHNNIDASLLNAANVSIVQGDLCSISTLDKIAAEAIRRNADILINNAAEYLHKSFDDTTELDIQRVLATNVFSPMLLTRKLWLLLKENRGVVLNINSLACKTSGRDEIVYSTSKHALAGFSDSMQFDATKYGVKVINVVIGKMITSMTAGQVDQANYIDPYEVASVVEAFCRPSDAKTYKVNELIITRSIY